MIMLDKSLIQNKNDKGASFNWKPQKGYFGPNFGRWFPEIGLTKNVKLKC